MRTHATTARAEVPRERDEVHEDRPLPSERMRQIRRMRRLHGLTPTEFIILHALSTYDGPSGIRIRQRTIADAEGIHRQAVNRAIAGLQRKGALVVRTMRNRACCEYRILYPEPRPVPDARLKQRTDNPTREVETARGQGVETPRGHIGSSGVSYQGTSARESARSTSKAKATARRVDPDPHAEREAALAPLIDEAIGVGMLDWSIHARRGPDALRDALGAFKRGEAGTTSTKARAAGPGGPAVRAGRHGKRAGDLVAVAVAGVLGRADP